MVRVDVLGSINPDPNHNPNRLYTSLGLLPNSNFTLTGTLIRTLSQTYPEPNTLLTLTITLTLTLTITSTLTLTLNRLTHIISYLKSRAG